MDKDKFELAKKNIRCKKGGTKEACLIIREYLQNCEIEPTFDKAEVIVNGYDSATSNEDFLNAVRVLLADTHNRNEDIVPEFYTCFRDCSRLDTDVFCPGEFSMDTTESGKIRRKECPYYIDSWRK